MMEITASCLDKYDIAKLIIEPPYKADDIIDIKIIFLSKKMPGLIKGFITMDKRGKYIPRSYGGTSPVTSAAQKHLRAGMKQLAVRLIGELDDV